jgi:hypothetical protein
MTTIDNSALLHVTGGQQKPTGPTETEISAAAQREIAEKCAPTGHNCHMEGTLLVPGLR